MRSYQVMSIVSVCVFVSVVVLCGVVGITTDIQSYKYWHRQPYSHLVSQLLNKIEVINFKNWKA